MDVHDDKADVHLIFPGTRATSANDNRMDAAARLINTLVLAMVVGGRRARLGSIHESMNNNHKNQRRSDMKTVV